MKLVALTLVRNDAWSIGPCIKAALRWCDDVVVFNHASTDATGSILNRISFKRPGRIHIITEPDPVWHEMQHRQRTLLMAREIGATHCAVIDADEMLTENLVPNVRDIATILKPGEFWQPPWVCCWRSLHRFRNDDSQWSHSWVTFVFRDTTDLYWTTRENGPVTGYDYHHRHPFNSTLSPHYVEQGQGGILHFQHANWDRLRWKQVWYRMTELIRWPEFGVEKINARYGPTSDESNMRLDNIPLDWLPPELADVDVNAEPWQKAEVHRLIKEHGRDYFKGIDFLGLDV